MSDAPKPHAVQVVNKYETMVSSGQSALRALLTMNAGATIAFLTVVGNLWQKEALPADSSGVFVDALQLFISGAFFAVLAYGMIFVTNCLSYVEYRRTSNWFFAITLACGFASIVCFIAGAWSAVDGFELGNRAVAARVR